MHILESKALVKVKKIILLFAFSFFVKLHVSAQLSKSQEDSIKTQIFQLGKNFGLNDNQANEYTACCLEKLKSEFPNMSKGTIEEARAIRRRIGGECLSKYTIHMAWSQQSEIILRATLNSLKLTQNLSEQTREIFNNCVIKKLKIAYPAGLTKVPEDVMLKIGNDCKKQISN